MYLLEIEKIKQRKIDGQAVWLRSVLDEVYTSVRIEYATSELHTEAISRSSG